MRRVRPLTALVLAGALSMVALVGRGSEPVHAQVDGASACVTVPLGSQGRAICTYLDTPSVDLTDLITAVHGSPSVSGIWIQAWGGRGADAPDDTNRGGSDGGTGGAGGYAQTYYDSLASYQTALGTETPMLYGYYGGNGGARTGVVLSAGGGGASTLVASADVTEESGPDYGPCIEADPDAVDQDGSPAEVDFHSANGALCSQSVVVLGGGGGGGGGTGGVSNHGKSGGAGGVAVAGTGTTVGRGADGDSQYPARAGIGGFNGSGGHNRKFPNGDGGDGIGGLGGPYWSSGTAAQTAGAFLGPAFIGGESNGDGGRGYTAQGNFGGGGGGGLGGGGGGGGAGTSGHAGGSGGGGGGSYAYSGDPLPDVSLPSGPPPTGAPSADQGAFRILIDGVGPPRIPPPPCIITLHGTAHPETLEGTTGGDDMYGYGGADTIIAGPGDDCLNGGHEGGTGGGIVSSLSGQVGRETLRGGRGDDRLFGGRGSELLLGGRGSDVSRGGPGDDRIRDARGHNRIYCGKGFDRVVTNRKSFVARNCERVIRK